MLSDTDYIMEVIYVFLPYQTEKTPIHEDEIIDEIPQKDENAPWEKKQIQSDRKITIKMLCQLLLFPPVCLFFSCHSAFLAGIFHFHLNIS